MGRGRVRVVRDYGRSKTEVACFAFSAKGLAVLVLSQLARADRANANRHPTMSDLRESSQLENDAQQTADSESNRQLHTDSKTQPARRTPRNSANRYRTA